MVVEDGRSVVRDDVAVVRGGVVGGVGSGSWWWEWSKMVVEGVWWWWKWWKMVVSDERWWLKVADGG